MRKMSLGMIMLFIAIGVRCAPVVPRGFDPMTSSQLNTVSSIPSNGSFSQIAPESQVNFKMERIDSMAMAPSGKILAIGEKNRVTLFDFETNNQILLSDEAIHKDATSLVFAPAENTLAVGSYKTIALWDIPKKEVIKTFSGHDQYVTALAVSPDGKWLASGSHGAEASILLWDLTSQKMSLRLTYTTSHAQYIRSIVFSPDGHALVSVAQDGHVRIWNIQPAMWEKHLENDPYEIQPTAAFFAASVIPSAVAVSPDGAILAMGVDDGNVVLLNRSGKKIGNLSVGYRRAVRSLAYSKDGNQLIAMDSDLFIHRWAVKTGQKRMTQTLNPHGDVFKILSNDRHIVTAGLTGAARFAPFASPPRIEVFEPNSRHVVDRPQVHLSGTVRDDGILSTVQIAVNNVLIQKDEGTRRDLTVEAIFPLDQMIDLIAGENQIVITAMDDEGLLSAKTIPVTYQQIGGKVWTVAIGVSRYQHVESLKYADYDAQAFYDYMVNENRVPSSQAVLLKNEEAKLERIRDVLGVEIKNNAGKNDTVVLFYAGHGAPEPDRASLDGDGLEKYILPYDADPNRLYSTALPMTEISKIFSRISAERIILIQDTCYSGSSILPGGRTMQASPFRTRAPIVETYLDRLTQGEGRVVLTASKANEVSLERDDLKHGVFTYYLLESLRHGDTDHDGYVTLTEAFRYVSKRVPEATNQNQHPVKSGIESNQELVIGRVWSKK